MGKAALALVAVFCLSGWPVDFASGDETLTFDAINNLIVSETSQEELPCEEGRVFFVRSGSTYCKGPNNDLCDLYMDFGQAREYPPYGSPAGTEGPWSGAVVGVNWPANQASGDFKIQPWEQAMDGPIAPAESCYDTVRFVRGSTAFKRKGFSYFVFDLTKHRRRQVKSATLRYKVSPWYSGSAQPQPTTTHVSFWDMNHPCENLVNDEKRDCFGSLVNDPAHNPLTLSSPIPKWTDVQYFTLDVTQSVQADLNDLDASGHVGFMVGSDDIANTPGMRVVGMGSFTLTVQMGPAPPPLVDSPPLTIPQLALGGGYSCVVMLNNNTAAAWAGRAVLRRGSDQPWDTPWTLGGQPKTGSTDFDLLLDAGSTNRFLINGDGTVRTGYLEIKGDPGFDAQDLLTSFFYQYSGSTGRLVDSTGTPAELPGTEFGFNVERIGSTTNTGIAFAPYSVKTPFGIRMALYDAEGGLTGTKQLTYSGHKAEFFTETFSAVQLPTDFVGSVRLRSEQSLFLTVLRLDTGGGTIQLTSVPPRKLLDLKSPTFIEGGAMPAANNCNGTNQSPALFWTKAPPGTVSWALLAENPDSGASGYVHWVVFNIPAEVRSLSQGALPAGAITGRNSKATSTYTGPCPASGVQHRVFFKLYALDRVLGLTSTANATQVRQAMEGHILGTAQLLGLMVGE